MVNHLRTLLINRAAASLAFGPGYQHVPADFVSVRETDAVQQARRHLFGASPDSLMLHYRVQQLLRVLETSRFADHITLYDNRLTTDNQQVWEDSLFGPSVTKRLVGASDPFFSGSQTSPDASGICVHRFDVEFDPPDTVRIRRGPGGVVVEERQVASSAGMTLPTELPETGYRISCPSEEAGRWIVQTSERPTTGPKDWLASIRSLSHERTLELFGDVSMEPNKSWWAAWQSARSALDRLSAAILAVGASLEARRL